jgi:hypothetical protein
MIVDVGWYAACRQHHCYSKKCEFFHGTSFGAYFIFLYIVLSTLDFFIAWKGLQNMVNFSHK